MPTSASMGQLARASTIAEEGGAATEGQEGGQVEGVEGADAQGDAGESLAVAADSQHSSISAPPRHVPASGQAGEMSVDTMFGQGGGPMGQVSPASDFRRGSMSPGVPFEGRYVQVFALHEKLL